MIVVTDLLVVVFYLCLKEITLSISCTGQTLTLVPRVTFTVLQVVTVRDIITGG